MPTTYSDIAVVTSPKIQITDERIEIVESTLLELKPFIEGMISKYQAGLVKYANLSTNHRSNFMSERISNHYFF